jgi:hypothetical protein
MLIIFSINLVKLKDSLTLTRPKIATETAHISLTRSYVPLPAMPLLQMAMLQ